MDTYDQYDLDLYFHKYTPNIPMRTHPIPAFIDGAVAPTSPANAGGESILDMTIIYPLIYPRTITLFQTDGPIYTADSLDGYLDCFFDTFLGALDGSFCTYSAYGQTGNENSLDPVYPDPSNQPGTHKGPLQCGVYKPTNVISISYLAGEAALPVNYQRRQCNEFAQLALQGVTILFASGDPGVACFYDSDHPNGACIGKDRKNLLS
ncbi:Hypothetical protein R9X50_00097400 [Acrodontium crateriforme]|uniref:Peptidase S53 domain-containing protein n=1 Tax=Acrodontium crateriforme TaxID=150365 RepID=A0AAQ3LYA5_9PEZI|nr:Hypothetical protein R9X50_00097400 [Acrodontium crateriforme]